MNAKELETQHNLKKWAAIIKECRSSGMKILQWLEINNISKDQYYYWQKKLKETCIDTFERQAATFVELPVTKEVPVSTELTVTHSMCENKKDDSSFKDNSIADGYTDLRRDIDGLAGIVQYQFELDPHDKDTIFLFCGRENDRIKALLWEGDGFLLMYKRVEEGSFKVHGLERLRIN